MVFRCLGFLDLTRCVHVCKTWSAYLPGDDTMLQEALFLKSRVPVQLEVQTITIKFSVAGYINRYPSNALPPANYELSVYGMQGHKPNKVNYHPFVIKPYKDMHIVNQFFGPPPTLPGFQWPSLPFTSLQDLRYKTRSIKGDFESGSWKDMLVCLPPAKTVVICFEWAGGKLIDNHTYKRRTTNDCGVTLGDLAEHVHIKLNEAGYRVSRFASDIRLRDGHLRESEDGDGRMVYDVTTKEDWPFSHIKYRNR
jgi:hypothetical protein